MMEENVARGVGSIEERVARGASKLDKLAPGWFHRIDLARLDMANAGWCVAGQLYGDYLHAMAMLFDLQLEQAAVRMQLGSIHGFNTEADGEVGAREHAQLLRTWTGQIEARRSAEV